MTLTLHRTCIWTGGNPELGDEAVATICRPEVTPKMTYLDIWECGMTTVPDWLDECVTLAQLNMRSNLFENVDDERKLRLEDKLSATWERVSRHQKKCTAP